MRTWNHGKLKVWWAQVRLLKQDQGNVEAFGEAVLKMRREIKFCQRCYNVADSETCSICGNPLRKQEIICVVENIRDVIAIESTQQFSGVYHVLGGIISPLDGIGPDQLTIDPLIQRIQKEKTEEHHTGVKRTYLKAKHKVKHKWNKAKATAKKEYNKAKTRITTDDTKRDAQEKK